MAAALAGLRALDLSNTLAGTQAGQLLADFGAEVVQIEPPGGSPLRAQPAWPFWARGKKSLVLDLASAADQAVAQGLAREFDVVIETWRPGVAERLGIGYDAARRREPAPRVRVDHGLRPQWPAREAPGLRGRRHGEARCVRRAAAPNSSPRAFRSSPRPSARSALRSSRFKASSPRCTSAARVAAASASRRR